jgi:predicted small lipoprotein YifL
MRRLFIYLPLIVFVVLVLAGCGKSGGGGY